MSVGSFRSFGNFDAPCLVCMGVFPVVDSVMTRHYFGADVNGDMASGKWRSKHDVSTGEDTSAGGVWDAGEPPF